MAASAPFTPRARRFLILSALLAMVSLGLPWGRGGAEGDGFYMPGTLHIGMCSNYTDYDGYMHTECGPTFYSPGWHVAGSTGSTTAAHLGVRVFLAGGIALVAVATALRKRSLLKASPFVIGIGLVSGGVGSGPGFATAIGAVLLLGWALVIDGHLTVPRNLGARVGSSGGPSTTI